MAATAEQVLATLSPREQQLIQDPTLPEDSKIALMSGLGMSAADITKVIRRFVDGQAPQAAVSLAAPAGVDASTASQILALLQPGMRGGGGDLDAEQAQLLRGQLQDTVHKIVGAMRGDIDDRDVMQERTMAAVLSNDQYDTWMQGGGIADLTSNQQHVMVDLSRGALLGTVLNATQVADLVAGKNAKPTQEQVAIMGGGVSDVKGRPAVYVGSLLRYPPLKDFVE
jgi:hypothetical protein